MSARTAPLAAPSALRAWLVVALLLAAGALVVGAGERAALDWRPAVALRQPWRFWSAAWVHLSTAHLNANLLGVVLVAMLGIAARLPMRAATAWALAWPLTHAGLLLRPDIVSYGGLSGVLHAGVAVAATALLMREHGRRRAVAAALLAALAIKVLTESPWSLHLPYSVALGITTVPFAHAAGAVAGVVCTWLLLAGARGNGRQAAAR